MLGASAQRVINKAKLTSDRSTLSSLLHLARHSEGNDWCICQAYILWRLSEYHELISYCQSLPLFFHQSADYWMLLALGYKSDESQALKVIECYEKALDLDSCRSDLNYNLANAYLSIDDNKSLMYYRKSLFIDPYQAQCWHNYAQILLNLGDYNAAGLAFKVSICLNPSDRDCLLNYGLYCMKIDKLSSAEHTFELCISLDPTDSKAHSNLGSTYLSNRDLSKAIDCYEEASSLTPSSSDALFNLGLCHLILGKFTSGWKYYESRLNTPQVPSSCIPTGGPMVTRLSDFSNPSNPVVVWAEQGLGDTIQFCRYLLLLDSLSSSYVFYVQQSLFNLISNWLPLNAPVQPLPESRHTSDNRPHCPLLSLPSLFQTTLATIPATSPYLQTTEPCPPTLSLPDPPGGLSIGIVWSSNIDAPMHKTKSIPLDSLLSVLIPFLDLDLIDLHSLQFGPSSNDLNGFMGYNRITNWSSRITDFSDTAFVISQLDLLITVDTACAHLAGSLGRPAWVLLPHDADFRWMSNRIDSPWYPKTMRLFRQHSRGDWSSVISDIGNALDTLFLVNSKEIFTDLNTYV